MTLVHAILKQMPGLGQPQRKCLATLFVTILVLRGRVTFRHLSRYCDDAERPIARQFREPFDGPDFPQRVLRTARDSRSELVSAHDASFLPQRGQQTFGLGHCLQRLDASCRTRSGDFHARGGRWHTPVRFDTRRRADAAGRERHQGRAGRHAGRLLHAAPAGASASLAAEPHLSWCGRRLCAADIY